MSTTTGSGRVAVAAGHELANVDFPSEALADVPVVAEGERVPEGVTRADRDGERPGIAQWIRRPGDLRDPKAYGVQIHGDSMAPAHRPGSIAIVSPVRRVQDGDEVYVRFASGECVVRLMYGAHGGYILQTYNPAYPARFVRPKEIHAMHVILYSRRRDF